jgi:hypothetical protein
MDIDTTGWSGEGEFTQALIDAMAHLEEIRFLRVEDAPATRSEADYNFISNEIYVAFAVRQASDRVTRFGFLPVSRTREEKLMTLVSLEAHLTAAPGIGAPDYSDDGLLQYLRTERIIPPYQTRGFKLVELVRIYEVGTEARR